MKIADIYKLAIKMGIDADLRENEAIEKILARKRAKYEKLSEDEKEEFDKESLQNPYSDTRILHISQDKEIKRALVGIDIEPAELLLAKELGGVDLVISHHPLGKALANLHEVMELQCDILNMDGVPINVAEGLMKERISEVARGVNRYNHQRTVDAARLLDFNLLCVHTPCDNLAARFLKEKIDEAKPERIEDLIKLLKTIPEFKEAMKIGAGPKIFAGTPENRCGKISLIEITGGTEGSPKLFEKMAQAGIGSVLAMHASEPHKEEAEKNHINLIVSGHMSSDSLGLNIFIDELQKRQVEIIPCSGFIRVSRVKTNSVEN